MPINTPARFRRNPFALLIPFCVAAWLSASPAHASDGAQSDPTAVRNGSLQAAAPIATDPLLPGIMSPGEKMFWGEHGLMRAVGGFPLTEEGRARELMLRRSMLTAHQIGGFITLAAMIATSYCGQMIINGNSGYEGAKDVLAWTTVGTYFGTAALSLLSPPPMVRRAEWNTISTHKALAWAHFTGMIVTPILGTMVEGAGNVRTLHQVSGYLTTATFAGAMYVVTF
jgi:hypothetical protein